jgi:aspartyl protease family protein
MNDRSLQILLVALLIVLPLSSLIARRVPFGRIVWMALSWAVIFGLGLFVLAQRAQFDPYIARVAKALNLDDQRVVGGEVRIRMAPDGHFWAKARIDGVERRMLIDSGATVTALSQQTAAEAGLSVHDSVFPMVIQTANGAINAKVSEVEALRLGDIRASDLPVVVSPAFGDMDVVGMNLLSRLKSWRVEGQTLVLEPHHPDPKSAA